MIMLSRVLLPVFVLLGSPIGGQLLRAQTAPGAQAVDTSYFVTLGGTRQYVEIRGASRDLPVLLYLHGGPCVPATPLLRFHQAALSQSFVLVSWDQRGCGRSAESDPRPADMTLERHVLDAHELTAHLKSAFGKQRLFLVGHSWGSILGVELAQRYPDDYAAYVGVGQVVNMVAGERIARDELLSRARARGDTATVQAVERIAFSPEQGYAEGVQGFLAQRRLLWVNRMMDYDPSAMLRAVAAAEGYPRDITQFMAAAGYAQGALFREIMTVDLTRRTAFRIPVFFFAGRHDYNTPSALAAQYMETIQAPSKGIFWFEGSGHSPPWEEPEAFRTRLLEVLATASRQGERPARPDFSSLDSQVAALMREWGAPGLAVAIVVDGQTSVLRGYGLRELGRPEPVDENTVFQLASVTKAFTAAALGILVDEGRLSWDDLVTTRVPPRFRFRDPRVAETLTIRDLLSHRTGYDGYDMLWSAFSYSRSEILERLVRLEPSSGLRERYKYNNLMYVLAGQVVESVSGLPWDRFVEERILRPLRMNGSAASVQRQPSRENVATPHARSRDGVVSVIPRRDAENIGPAGGMLSSAADMAEWLKLLLASGTAGGRRILSAGTVREMWTPQMQIRPEEDVNAGLLSVGGEGPFSYGLGWFVHEYGGHTVVEHNGVLEGMSPAVVLVPELRAGFVILTNISMPTGVQYALRLEILDALLGITGSDRPAAIRAALQRAGGTFARAAGVSAAAGGERVPPTLPLSSYAGSYTRDAYGDIQVLSGERGLAVRFGQRGVVSQLVPLSGDQFLLVWQSPLFPPVRCTFEIDDGGRVRAAVFAGQGPFQGRFDRMEARQ